MQSNYKAKVKPGALALMKFASKKKEEAWILTAPERMQEYDAVAEAMEISMLYALATDEKDPHGAIRLRRDWEGMLRARVKARAVLRQQEGEYQLAATAKNVEDFYMLEELRKRGANVREWIAGLEIDYEKGEVIFHN